jgi:hypothetical protein
MIKKSFIAGIIVLLFAISILVEMQVSEVVDANPYMYMGPTSTRTDTNPPIVSIFSPTNTTFYNLRTVVLSFNVSEPTGPHVLGPPTVSNSPFINVIYYKASWLEQNVTVYEYSSDPYSGHATNGQYTKYSNNLNLTKIPEGHHSITVYTQYSGLYFPSTDPGAPLSTNSFLIWGSSTVNFTIDTINPTPTPTPSVPEFSWLIILPLFLFTISIVVLIRKGKVQP